MHVLIKLVIRNRMSALLSWDLNWGLELALLILVYPKPTYIFVFIHLLYYIYLSAYLKIKFIAICWKTICQLPIFQLYFKVPEDEMSGCDKQSPICFLLP